MHQLALILGEPTHVHFRRLQRGSTILKYDVDREAVPKVSERVTLVRRGEGEPIALKAFEATNKMLRDDNGVADLKVGAVILPFPGRDQVREEFTSVRQHGFFDGVVTGVSGHDVTRHITMHAEDKKISGFVASPTQAKLLMARYDEPVRVFGKGKWKRDDEGNWELVEFKIENFEALDDSPLSAALDKLRRIPTEWSDDAYSELAEIRHGLRDKGNGGN
jgi:hypothetical protein